jgi:predicted PurR-regulated permease PerM
MNAITRFFSSIRNIAINSLFLVLVCPLFIIIFIIFIIACFLSEVIIEITENLSNEKKTECYRKYDESNKNKLS